MNPMMHHTPAEASGDSRASGSSSHELQRLDRVSKLLVGFISQLNKEGYESSRLKASIGTALFKHVMRYAPENSHYFNRDRLVVSGHYAGRWQDLFVHLIAAKGLAVDPLGVASVFSRTTTLPCHSNQAISSAIGQAIAMRNLTMLYNKPGLELLDNMIWCVIDDAKFQQDSALNTVALAGSWKLSNLCIIYDSMYDSMSDKLEVNNLKTRGWNVIELVNDDDLTITALCTALSTSRRSNAPTLINVQSPNSSLSHWLHSHPNNNTPLYLPLELYDVFQDVFKKSNLYEADWLVRVKRYRELYPALAREFWNHVAGKPATITQHQTALTGPITPPLSPWPAEQRSRRGDHSSLGRDKFSQQPDRRSRPGRTKPETLHIRPCDAEEAAGAFLVSIRSTKLPTTISLPQNGAASFPGHSSRLGVTLGAYTFSKCHDEDFDLTLMTAGVGIHYAMGTQEFLIREYGLKARIVSCPCLRLFQLQTEEYRRSVLQMQSRKPTVAIDFGNSQGWKPYADALVLLKESVSIEIEANMPNRIGPRHGEHASTSPESLSQVKFLRKITPPERKPRDLPLPKASDGRKRAASTADELFQALSTSSESLEATFEDLRFDYEPRHERITFRMPLRIHDIFTHFISEAIHEAVREVGRNNEDVHRFTENVIKGSTSDINTSEKKKKRSADEKEDDPVKKRRSPDSQSIYVGAQQPRIVIEVAASQDAKQLSKLAKGYIHDTWGDIKAVLCFALNKSNGSSLSLWKAKYTWCRFSGARHRLLFKPRRRADHIPYSPNIRQRV
ncbi:hypothetical protein H9L39_15819 [Fusarium oxysporum f. sp. albedinis]|nr:hypothetical protein H9L39_15819 [Fusarium oxysporum f. sp. albedinis]